MSGVLERMIEAAGGAPDRKPPVHLWNPATCGDIDIRIGRDGVWRHEGAPIQRPALVRLFASILRREGGDYWLVTPVEKMRIAVDDAPFLAVGVERRGWAVAFATNVGDVIEAAPDHPVRVETDPATGEPSPYVLVRDGLEARIVRAAFYDLVALADPVGGRMVVASNGALFDLGATGEEP